MEKEIFTHLKQAAIRYHTFFDAHEPEIIASYDFLEAIANRYVEACKRNFNSFSISPTSLVYGSIHTMAIGFLYSNKLHFNGLLNDEAFYFFTNIIFNFFIEKYETEDIVSKETQLHMLKITIENYFNIIKNPKIVYKTKFDKFYVKDISPIYRYYNNHILTYCIDKKKKGFTENDVIDEVLPKITKIFNVNPFEE